MYYGKVTDKNGNPIERVPVSDGRNIVLTDKNGLYKLDGFEKSHTVCVMALTRSHNDWYYYTDGKEGEYNFEIDQVYVSGEFNFLHTSDTEIHERENVAWLPFAKESAKKLGSSFIIHTGDICRKEGLEKHYKLMNNETMDTPVRYVIGNHDYCDGDYGEQLFEKLYGPVWYSFELSNIHFIVLSLGSGEKPEGYTADDQLLWLENDLKLVSDNKKIIVFDHDSATDDYNFVMRAQNNEIDFKKYDLLAWVFGHYHMNYHHIRNGIANICTTCPDCGGADSSAAGIRVINIKDSLLSSRMLYNGLFENTADKSIWETKLFGNIEFSVLQTYKDSIIACTFDDGYPRSSGIFCLDKQTGVIRWFTETEGGIRNIIAISQDKIYAVDSMGNLYCLNAENGDAVYKKFLEFHNPDFIRTGVLCVKDKIFTGKGNQMYAINKDTGDILWQYTFRRGSNSAVMPVYDQKTNTLIVSNHWRYMALVDADTGKELWQNADILVWHRNSTPVIENDIIYTCSDHLVGKLDLKTGEVIAKKDVADDMNTVGTPLIYDNLVFFPTSEHGVYAFDKNTLEIVHRYPASHSHLFTTPYGYNEGERQMVESSPIIIDNTLIFGASDGKVYFYDVNTEKLIKTITVKGPVLTNPIIDGDDIYIADFLGNVYKF